MIARLLGVLVGFALCSAGAVAADDYSDARAELIAAYQSQNYPAMVVAAEKSLASRPGFPGALFNLALAQALHGDVEASLRTLQTLTSKGVDFGVADAEQFASVRELDGWPAVLSKIEALYQPVGEAVVAARYPVAEFIPEGIAVDSGGNLYLGSIRKGQLVRVSATPEVLSDRDGHWSVFGMRFHPDGSLWFASSAVAQLVDVGGDEGRAGLFRFDLASSTISKAAILPAYAENQVLGDLVIANANTIYTTDSVTGGVYRYNIDANEFEILIEPGRLVSPQGLVLDESGNYLYIADYNGGLYRASLVTRAVAKVRIPDNTTDYGVDGLYRYGDELIVIQNGIRPHRVVALQLDESGLEITGHRVLASNLSEFDEPTLGTIRGDSFYFVANSHWNRFDADSTLPDGLEGPVVLKISLR